jgi:hypothetical protein
MPSVPTNNSGSTDNSTVSKNKKFKRIRGFLSGESRRERKERKAREKQQRGSKGLATGLAIQDDDDATVYQVNFDERSIATAPVKHDAFHGNEGNKSLLKVVLLLMDPKSRRFELLQLEFDSLKALVSDVMAQIPLSVTEEALRKQTYLGICGRDGTEMPLNSLLSQFCKGNDVLVAVPKGVAATECARLALPILTDANVVKMLRSSEIDVSDWVDSKKKKSKKAIKSSTGESDGDSSEGGTKTVTFILIIMAAIFLQVYHLYVSAPIKTGHVVSPGIRLSRCGILPFMPSCSNAYLSFENDGTVVLKDSSNALLWEIKGGVCRKTDKNCIPGMKVEQNGEVVVGGKSVSYVYTHKDDIELSPWPFAEQPKLRIKRSSYGDSTSPV